MFRLDWRTNGTDETHDKGHVGTFTRSPTASAGRSVWHFNDMNVAAHPVKNDSAYGKSLVFAGHFEGDNDALFEVQRSGTDGVLTKYGPMPFLVYGADPGFTFDVTHVVVDEVGNDFFDYDDFGLRFCVRETCI